MDNLTHTLVGAALAESGLKRRTALGTATLMIGANFPDIDVIAVPLGYGIEWRRGVTHGFLALAILPFVLAAIMRLWDRHVRRRRDPRSAPADYRQVLVLSAIAIATHPALDFMNTYGMRWLMPFVDKWFYADGLFIVDAWVIIALILGVLLSRRLGSTRPARVALGGMAAYTVGMLWLTSHGRREVEKAYPYTRYMVAPEPLAPWRRSVIVEADGYRHGTYSPFGGLSVGPAIERGEWVNRQRVPAVALAMRDARAQGFLKWARFPYFRVRQDGSARVVWMGDARYSGADWASVEVRLP